MTLPPSEVDRLLSSVAKGTETLLEAANLSGGVGRDKFTELLEDLELGEGGEEAEEAKEAIRLLANRQYYPPHPNDNRTEP